MRGPCKWLENRRAFPLLVALIVLMLVPPLLDESKLTRTCFGLVMLATMFTAIYAMSEKRYFRPVVISTLATRFVILSNVFTNSFSVTLLE